MFSIRPQLLFWLCAAFAVFGQAMVLRALLAGRTPASDVSFASRAREALWIVLPAIAVSVVLFATWRAILVPERAPGGVGARSRPVAIAPMLRASFSEQSGLRRISPRDVRAARGTS